VVESLLLWQLILRVINFAVLLCSIYKIVIYCDGFCCGGKNIKSNMFSRQC
jgi:hypothetical protein